MGSQRRLVGVRRGPRLGPMQGLGQIAPQDEAERQHQGAQQEGEAPAPYLQAGRSGHGGQGHPHQPSSHRSEILAAALPGAVEAALGRRRGLDQEGGGRSHLAAQGKPLAKPPGQGEDRRQGADHGVGRRQGQTQYGHAHQGEAEQHGRPASLAVGVSSDQHRADRAQDEPRPEGRQRQQQADERRMAGEKVVADLHGEIGVGGEIVELQGVAHHRGGDLARGDAALGRIVRRRGDGQGHVGHRRAQTGAPAAAAGTRQR